MIISYGLQMKPDWLAHLIQGGRLSRIALQGQTLQANFHEVNVSRFMV